MRGGRGLCVCTYLARGLSPWECLCSEVGAYTFCRESCLVLCIGGWSFIYVVSVIIVCGVVLRVPVVYFVCLGAESFFVAVVSAGWPDMRRTHWTVC